MADPLLEVVRIINDKIGQSVTRSARGKVVAVDGANVSFTVGDGLIARVGRWVGAGVPQVGDVIVYIDEPGRSYPLVLATMGPITQLWTAPSLLNGWANFGGVHQVAQYRKIGDIVYVRGLVKSGGAGTPIFQLPAGYRPPATLIVGEYDGGFPMRIDYNPDGNVAHFSGATGAVPLNFQFSVTA